MGPITNALRLGLVVHFNSDHPKDETKITTSVTNLTRIKQQGSRSTMLIEWKKIREKDRRTREKKMGRSDIEQKSRNNL